MSTTIRQISLIQSCEEHCFHKRIDKFNNNRVVLDVDLSYWYDINNLSLILQKNTQNYKNIRLILNNIQSINQFTCDIIAETIGPRITEIYINNCSSLSWNNDVKRILNNSKFITTLILINNNWLDDIIMEQLAKRYKKSLMHLEIENSLIISDRGIIHFGRRCKLIHTFKMICCSKITDISIIEIAKNNHISILNLSHNLKITDESIECILSTGRHLQSITLINNILLTDRSISSLYEANTSWGKKRNMESQTMTVLECRDNDNFTSQCLTYISASIINITKLDLRDCINIDLIKGMSEIMGMNKIIDLKIGPMMMLKKSPPFDSNRFLQAMSYQASQLLSLHLVGLSKLNDQYIGDLIEQTINLNDLTLENLDFASLTIESICSNIPNISNIHLIGSNQFADIDLRCLTTVCRNIINLTIQRCPLLTDAGFTRFVCLKQLQKLNLSHCSYPSSTTSAATTTSSTISGSRGRGGGSGQCSGNIIKFLSVSPITSLVLDGLLFHKVNELFPALMKSTLTKLEYLSIRNCRGIKLIDINYLLERFIACRILDCTDCPDLPTHTIRSSSSSSHHNPFLSYEQSNDFSGYKLRGSLLLLYEQYWALQFQLRRHYGAKLLQRLRRRYIQRCLELKQDRRDRWSNFKLKQLVIIQAYVRSYLIRKVMKKKLYAGRRIVQGARNYLFYQNYLKEKKASLYYQKYLIITSFQKIMKHHIISKNQSYQLSNQTKFIQIKYKLKYYFKLLKVMQHEFKERSYEKSAVAYYQVNYLIKIISYWKTCIFKTKIRKQQLVLMFLQCTHLTFYNSFNQMNKINRAINFNERRLYMIAWMIFAKDIMEIRRINSLIPLALNHAMKTFFNRVMKLVFHYGLQQHRKNRLIKRHAKNKAIEYYYNHEMKYGVLRFNTRCQYKLILKSNMLLTKSTRLKYIIKLGIINRFPRYTRHSLYYKKQYKYINNYICHRLFTYGYSTFKVNIVKSKKFREMMHISIMKYYNILSNKTYKAWVIFTKNNKTMGEYYYKKYILKLQKKIMMIIKMNHILNKDYVQSIKLLCDTKLKTKDGFSKVLKVMKRIQATFRARKLRLKYIEERVQKLYSIQVLQNFIRTMQARKIYSRRLKKQLLSSVIKGDNELDLMRIADIETQYYNYQIRAIINFQRIYRGWKGRRIAMERAIEYFRESSADYYSQNKISRLRHEAYRRFLLAKEHQKVTAAVEIQKIIRGYLAKKRVEEVRQLAKKTRYTIYVQKYYRRRLAMLKLQGMKRDINNIDRFNSARKQRGFMMRLFNFKTRKQQDSIASILKATGLDPMSFNYRVMELFQDTYHDFFQIIQMLRRERLLVQQNGYDEIALTVGRRKILQKLGLKPEVHDAVKIIEEGHPYQGYTGRVTRIDDSLIGLPLYEVKLDHKGILTFTRMTTDSLLAYTSTQPLVKIEKHQKLINFKSHEYADIDDPFFSKKNMFAAWKIQCAYRCYRAKKIVNRSRYEFWLRSISRQWSLYNHLSETNTLTTQGYNVAWLLKVLPKRKVFYDELRHVVIPGRYLKQSEKIPENTAIMREYMIKYRDRMTYLQKCAILNGKDYFATGYQPMTSSRKLFLTLKGSTGFISKGLSCIRGLFGSKGVKELKKQTTLVTGLDKYFFPQFVGSPHVRYHKVSKLFIHAFL